MKPEEQRLSWTPAHCGFKVCLPWPLYCQSFSSSGPSLPPSLTWSLRKTVETGPGGSWDRLPVLPPSACARRPLHDSQLPTTLLNPLPSSPLPVTPSFSLVGSGRLLTSRSPLSSLPHSAILVLLDLSELGLNLPCNINGPVRSAGYQLSSNVPLLTRQCQLECPPNRLL